MITFETGEAVALIRIPIVDNTAVESDEIFIVALSSEGNNVMIDGKSVTIMILDPDSKYSKRIVSFMFMSQYLPTVAYCLNYTVFKNGKVSLSGVSTGDTATFTCNDGYELVGDSSLICLSDGTWDSSPPVCQGPTGTRYSGIIHCCLSLCCSPIVSFEPNTYTVTEGVDEFVELIIKAENVKTFVAIHMSFTSESAKGTHSFLPQCQDDLL